MNVKIGDIFSFIENEDGWVVLAKESCEIYGHLVFKGDLVFEPRVNYVFNALELSEIVKMMNEVKGRQNG